MTRGKRSRLVGVWCLAASLQWAVLTPAAAQSPEPDADDRADTDEEIETREAAEPGGVLDVFVPTEEISEDFTVSFPVDI